MTLPAPPNLPFERSLAIVNPHRRVTEPSPVDGVVNGLPFFEIKWLDAFGLEGFPESAAEKPDVDDSRGAHARESASTKCVSASASGQFSRALRERCQSSKS